MDAEGFERIAARFERLSNRAPRAYRILIAALGLLGFGVVGLVILAMGALLALLAAAAIAGKTFIALKVGIPIALTLAALLKAVWVKLERPPGLRLEPHRAPALFAEIERIRRLGRVPRIHRVVVNGSLNAGLSQTPRLGVLGWTHNDLVLGLPLLLSVSPASFRAVLAHELGHLSGRHGRTGAFIYRVRVTWMQVLTALEQRQRWLGKVLRLFFRWYGPFFGAASLALAREQEREADRFAALATGPRIAADALAAIHLADWALEGRYWPAMARRAIAEPEPPGGYLAGLEAEVRGALRDPAASTALARALLPTSRGVDTHPALAERLLALGEEPRLPPPCDDTAAAHYLGAALPAAREDLDSKWRASVLEPWARLHEERAAQTRRLSELEATAAAGALAPEQAWERVSLAEQLVGAEEALALARQAAERWPDHAPTRFGLGRLLLERGDEAGVAHVERSIALDRDAELPGSRMLAAYYLSCGRNDLARPWKARTSALEEDYRQAAEERKRMLASDEVEPHGLAPEAAAALVSPVRGHPGVAQIFLVRKRLRHFPEREPVFVVAIIPRRPWHRFVSGGADARLARELAATLPTPAFVFVKGSATRRLFRRVKRIAGARVA